jgi:hypothetical protein
MAFNLEIFPVSYHAKYDNVTGTWKEHWLERDRIPSAELRG